VTRALDTNLTRDGPDPRLVKTLKSNRPVNVTDWTWGSVAAAGPTVSYPWLSPHTTVNVQTNGQDEFATNTAECRTINAH